MTYMFTFEDNDSSPFFCESNDVISAIILAGDYVGGVDDVARQALLKCNTMDEALKLYNKLNPNDYYRISLVHKTELLWSQFDR